MNAIYDSKEKLDLLMQLVMKMSGEDLCDFTPISVTMDYISHWQIPVSWKRHDTKAVLCVNLKHKLTKDIVHLACSLGSMDVRFCEGAAKSPAWHSMKFSQNNYDFVNVCKTLRQKFAAYALFTGNVQIIKAVLASEKVEPVVVGGCFGYVLSLDREKELRLFLVADYGVCRQPFRIIEDADIEQFLPPMAWVEALPQKADRHFFYFDGKVFIRRFGKYVTAREAMEIVQRETLEKGTVLYKNPIGVYYKKIPFWLIGGIEKDGYRFFNAVSLDTGAMTCIGAEESATDLCLAFAGDRLFYID